MIVNSLLLYYFCMARRRKNKKVKVALIVIGVIIAAAIISGAGIKLKDFIVAEIILIVFVLGIALFVFIWNLPVNKGKRGEKRVARLLERLADKYSGYVVNDVIIPSPNGGTSQIDHVLFCTLGAVVVETKNYGGRLYGKADQQYWTQVLAYGNTKNKMYNPLLQNKTHIYNLKRIIGGSIEYHSCVVILRANLDYLDAYEEVFTLREFKNSLNNELKEPKYSETQIKEAYDKLIEYKNNPIATTKEHVKNIKETQKDIDNNICPRCGGQLVLRTGKSGYQFYGCSNYPKCKFIKKPK